MAAVTTTTTPQLPFAYQNVALEKALTSCLSSCLLLQCIIFNTDDFGVEIIQFISFKGYRLLCWLAKNLSIRWPVSTSTRRYLHYTIL